MCNPCAKWNFETAETWGLRYDGVGVSGISLYNCFKAGKLPIIN